MMVGLGAKLAMSKTTKPTRECERCGLSFNVELTECPYCSGLDDVGLRELKRKLERERQANRNLGRLFFYLAMLIGFGVLLIAL